MDDGEDKKSVADGGSGVIRTAAPAVRTACMALASARLHLLESAAVTADATAMRSNFFGETCSASYRMT